MKKFLNDPEDCVEESVAGLVGAHPGLLAMNEAPLYVRRKQVKRQGVAVISGGGSGHEPLDTGFVGRGMLDAACPGRVFTAPTPDQIVAAARRVGKAQGVLLVVKNYPGDVNSFQLARDMLDMPVEQVLVNDDVAYADHGAGRRGVAGTLVVMKIAGAAAQSRNASAWATRPTSGPPPLAWRWAVAACPGPRRHSRSAPRKWKWASACTGSPAGSAAWWPPPTRSSP